MGDLVRVPEPRGVEAVLEVREEATALRKGQWSVLGDAAAERFHLHENGK